jgi:hypothetical protein
MRHSTDNILCIGRSGLVAGWFGVVGAIGARGAALTGGGTMAIKPGWGRGSP